MEGETLFDISYGFFRSVAIKNFRGIKHLELNFVTPKGEPSPVVVLAGPNGSGKTSILEACLIVSGHPRYVRGPLGGRAIRLGAMDFEIDGEFSDRDGGRTKISLTATSQFAEQLDSCIYLHSGRNDSLVGPLGITAGMRQRASFGPVTYSASSKKKNAKTGASSRGSRLKAIKQHIVNAWAHSLAADGEGSGTAVGHYHTILDKIDKLWSIFYPGSGQEFVVKSAGPDPDDGFDVYLQNPGSKLLPVDFLSSGQLELFTLAGATAILKAPPKVVFIDEIELHLDPQWHRLILRALRALLPGSQLIVTTHSPEVYNSVRSFERHFLVPDGDPRAKDWREVVRSDEVS